MLKNDAWNGFEGRIWKLECNVRDFIQNNYTSYDGDESFLEGPTEATDKLWGRLQELQKAERENGGVLDEETEIVSGLTSYGPGHHSCKHKHFVRLPNRRNLRRYRCRIWCMCAVGYNNFDNCRSDEFFYDKSLCCNSTYGYKKRRLRTYFEHYYGTLEKKHYR